MSQRYDFEIIQGSRLTKIFTLTLDGAVFSLVDYNARLQIRERVSDEAALLSLDSLAEIGLGSTRLVVVEATGLIVLALEAADTATLDFGLAAYSLEIYTVVAGEDDTVERLLHGYVTLSKDVNR